MSYICAKSICITSQSEATFKCCHCGSLSRKNVRIKSQRYCGSKACQQARKNKWERNKLRNDLNYSEKRCSEKKAWYKNYSGHRYQSSYRANHPDYVSDNREKQRLRASKVTQMTMYEKIVKTDTIIVELRSINEVLQVLSPSRSP